MARVAGPGAEEARHQCEPLGIIAVMVATTEIGRGVGGVLVVETLLSRRHTKVTASE